MNILIDLTGRKFGRYSVLKRSPKNNRHRQPMWLCLCDCGNRRLVMGQNLRLGHSRSCGCLGREIAALANKTHGEAGVTRSREYRAFAGMLSRCYSRSSSAFKWYGGRGIRVCRRWRRSFPNFLADMGRAPSPKHSLDRLRSKENYGPGNCRWATTLQQANNRSSNQYLTHKDVTRTVTEWSRETGLKACTIRSRIETGWSTRLALETPLKKQ